MAKKKDTPEDNALLKELKEVEFIKQPYLYAMIGADFTLVQRSIMIEIMNSLQNRFNLFLKHKKQPDETGQLSLFTDEERHEKIKTFKISAASLGIKPREYGELEEACNNLIRMNFSYLKYDKKTGTWARTYANLFSSITIPSMINPEYKYKNEDKKRRLNYIEARMDVDILEYLCDLGNGKGYMDHIYKIARISKRKRTPSIYIYLARWAKDFPKKAVNYIELKKFLGVISLEPEKDENGKTVNVEKDKYPKFSKFCKEVMDPIKKDLDRLAEDNAVDFTFDYEPVYPTGTKRGNPQDILFHIRLSRLGEELRKQRKRQYAPSEIWDLLRGEYKLSDTDIRMLAEMLPEELTDGFRTEVLSLMERIKNYKINNKKSYVVTSLRNYILKYVPNAEIIDEKKCAPVKGKEKVEKVSDVSEKDRKSWDDFMDLLANSVTFNDYTTWFKCLKFVSFKNNTLTVSVPTQYVYSYIEQNFIEPLSKAVKVVYGDKVELLYVAQNN